ncbi:MAG: ABC transporter substrate-binding protein [Patescibacteria group bacterium]
MSNRTKIVWGVIALIAAVWLIVFADKNSKEVSGEPIKIGVIAPLTGPFADYGEEIRKGVLVGIGDANVELIFEDEQCDAKTSVSAFQKLTSIDNVKFIIGPGCGSPQEAIVPLLSEREVLALVPSAASRNLFEQSGKYFFNVQYALEDESKFLAEEIYARGHMNVALVSYGNAFSHTHAESFKEAFKGKIISDVVLLDDNANLLPELTKIKALGADAIYSPDVTFFFGGALAKMEQLGMDVPVFTTYVAELPAVIPLVEGVYYSFPEGVESGVGAVFSLSKQSADILTGLIKECDGESACVRDALLSSDDFDAWGTYKRDMIMKRIQGGTAVAAE